MDQQTIAEPSAAGVGAPPAAAPQAPIMPPVSAPQAPEQQAQRTSPLVSDLPQEALDARIKRAREQAFKEEKERLIAELGTADVSKLKAEIQANKEKLAQYEQAEQEKKRAEMTELERYKLDLLQAQKERDEYQAKVQEFEDRRVTEEQEQVVQAAAGQSINPRLYKLVRQEFINYVRLLEKEEPAKLDALDDAAIAAWFKAYAKEFPEVALQKGDMATVKKPITNGAAPDNKPTAPKLSAGNVAGSFGGKTPRPGFPNSMNSVELNQYMKATGRSKW